MGYTYYYPKLSNRDYGWFRVGGPGLANCLFFAVNAYVHYKQHGTMGGAIFIEPTWRKFSIGPWIRREKDKRFYNSLFNVNGVSGLKKLLYRLLMSRKNTHIYNNLGNYFQDFNTHIKDVNEYISGIIKPSTICNVPRNGLEKCVSMHVRLGDYLPHLRIPITWYVGMAKEFKKKYSDIEILLFSDGNDEELKDLLALSNVKRVFYGNAFADMYAISKTKMVIASDSTFSAWGAFIGQRPILFNRRHFPPLYNGNIPEEVIGDEVYIPTSFEKILKSQ